MKKEIKKKSKISQLEEYTKKVNNEINEHAINKIKHISKDAEIIAIDDDQKPIIIVLCSDILGGSHNIAIENASTFKISNMAIKSINAGELPPPDINSILPAIQGIFTSLPTLISCAGSFIECIGTNVTKPQQDIIFQWGLAAHLGATTSNALKAPLMREIGICLGNLYYDRNKKINYDKFSELVKQLPRNKYKNRLIELAELYYNTEPEKSNGKQIEQVYKATKEATDSLNKCIEITNKIEEELDKEHEIKPNPAKLQGGIKTEINSEGNITFISEPYKDISKEVKERKKKAIEIKTDDSIKFISGD